MPGDLKSPKGDFKSPKGDFRSPGIFADFRGYTYTNPLEFALFYQKKNNV